MSEDVQDRPVRVALRNDYEIVLDGFKRMLERYRDRVEVVEELEQRRIDEPVDVALYDTFAQHEAEHDVIAEMVANPMNRHVAVFSWNLAPELVDAAVRQGAHGYFAKSMTAAELVEAVERVARGEVVLSSGDGRVRANASLDWPGRADGVSDRESEVLALVTQGRSNADIADLTRLSPNTVKTHIRSAYRKIGAANRVEAVLWGVQNGFLPDHERSSADRRPTGGARGA